MDAIYWACQELTNPNGDTLREVLHRRIGRDIGRSEIFFGYNQDAIIEISLSTKAGKTYTFQIGRSEKIFPRLSDVPTLAGVRFSLSAWTYSLLFKTGEEEWYFVKSVDAGLRSRPPYHSSYENKVDSDMLRYAKESDFLSSHLRINDLSDQLDKNLGELKLAPELEKRFCRMMKEIVGSPAYEFTPRPENPSQRIITFQDGQYRVFGEFQGAGLLRVAQILSTGLLRRGTGLFIEEIETYLHPKSLEKLAGYLIEIAKEHDIQLL